MRRMVDGLAGWATYQQAAGAKQLYNEHFFYQPMRDIATGRHWEVRAQAKISNPCGRKGAPHSIDFIFFRRPQNGRSRAGLVFVEVKYLRGNDPSQDVRELRKDIDKLRALSAADIEHGVTLCQCGSPAKFLLVMGQLEGLKKDADLQSKTHPGVVRMLKRGMADPRPSTYVATTETYLSDELEWHMMAFGEARWPK